MFQIVGIVIYLLPLYISLIRQFYYLSLNEFPFQEKKMLAEHANTINARKLSLFILTFSRCKEKITYLIFVGLDLHNFNNQDNTAIYTKSVYLNAQRLINYLLFPSPTQIKKFHSLITTRIIFMILDLGFLKKSDNSHNQYKQCIFVLYKKNA